MIDGIMARLRSLWRGVRYRADVEAEMHVEVRFHVDARVEDLVRAGLSRREATRRARIEFGSFERHKDEARASRGLRPFDELAFSWLDVSLPRRERTTVACANVGARKKIQAKQTKWNVATTFHASRTGPSGAVACSRRRDHARFTASAAP